jgi:hypothetical protein
MEIDSSSYSCCSLRILIFDKKGLYPNRLLAFQSVPLSLLPTKTKALYSDLWISLQLQSNASSSLPILSSHFPPQSHCEPKTSQAKQDPAFIDHAPPPPLVLFPTPSPTNNIMSTSRDLVERSISHFAQPFPPPFYLRPSNSESSQTLPQIKIGVLSMDQASLWKLKATIYDIEEVPANEFFCVCSFYYKVLLQRNDGLEWRIRKRYSDFRNFRKIIKKINQKVPNFFIFQ